MPGMPKKLKTRKMTSEERIVTDNFHNLYYNGTRDRGPIFTQTTWIKIPSQKCPLDLWVYQEIISEIQPDLIIETGTRFGGSALFMAHIMDILGKGKIFTIDIDNTISRPAHSRITYVHGSSADAGLINNLLPADRSGQVCMVVLDSDHSKEHVLQELNLLASYVSVGSYLVVEDTNVNGHPALPYFGEGPYEAVKEFLDNHAEFIIDESREKFLMTFNPGGYLRRIA